MKNINRVVIVGGGTAGWMAAAAFSKSFGKQLHIELIESDEIGTVGVGEATIPPIKNFHLLLELDEADFLRAVNGTYKLGIQFENWGQLGEQYFHPFSAHGVDTWAAQFHHFWVKARQQGETAALDEFSLEALMARANKFGQQGARKAAYAYHFDAGLYAKMLRGISEKAGVKRTEGKVVDVKTNSESGFIESVALESGDSVDGDLFIDCSGFRGLLIEQTLKTGWEDWSHWLLSDRAVAVQTELVVPPAPFTRATARSCGWQWKIPLQNRVGNGLVFCSNYMSDDEAHKTLLDNLEGKPITEPRVIRFKTGRRLKQWNKNCIALGLSSGFLEPLESTSIHLIQNNIIRLIKLFPSNGIEQSEIDQFNREVKTEIEYIRDFIIAHYHVTRRADNDYWIERREMTIPETLAHKLSLFGSGGKIFRDNNELFTEPSWVAVLVGQGLEPASYHPFVNNMSDKELRDHIARVRMSLSQLVNQQPSHHEFIQQYCKVAAA
ncbi:MAG: tryptophan 7-halogenase [Woeseia sp.]|nr:tryptophan 7-halogenase [Woeseia sp.]MBT8096363.1 tryptophan 7-halogenase [Woeseia sp.]NNE61453.1 tryptophan 7-halogenase [Woeseia sp.]